MTETHTYQYIMFDWDGCLARNLHLWINICRRALANQGVTASTTEIMLHYGTGQLPERLGAPDPAACRRTIGEIAARELSSTELQPGARELLRDLRSRRHVALVSNARPTLLSDSLRRNQVEDAFELIISGQDVTRLKPDPEGLERALDQMGGHKSAAVMIGDSSTDIQAAHNAGIDSILVYPPEHEAYYDHRRLRACRPTHTVRSFAQLRHLLLKEAVV